MAVAPSPAVSARLRRATGSSATVLSATVLSAALLAAGCTAPGARRSFGLERGLSVGPGASQGDGGQSDSGGSSDQSSDDSSGQSSDDSSGQSTRGGGGGGSPMPGGMADTAEKSNNSNTSESSTTTRQGKSESDSQSDDGVASASVVFLSLLSVATLVLIIYLGTVSSKESTTAPGATPAPSPAELEHLKGKARDYLVGHRRSLRAALARGDGPFVSELASALALPPDLHPQLGRALHRDRAALDRWLAAPDPAAVDRAAAVGFGAALVATLEADAALAPHLARHRAAFLARAE